MNAVDDCWIKLEVEFGGCVPALEDEVLNVCSEVFIFGGSVACEDGDFICRGEVGTELDGEGEGGVFFMEEFHIADVNVLVNGWWRWVMDESDLKHGVDEW